MKLPKVTLKTMLTTTLIFCGAMLAILGAGVVTRAAQTAAGSKGLLYGDTFDVTEGGWVAFGGGAQVRLTPDAARVKTGKPALALEYNIAPKQLAAAVLPIPEGTLTRMTSLRFWLKTDSAVPVAVLLSEKKPGGGNYTAVVWSPKDTWQKIELIPDDFALTDGPNDPKDSDNKLDLDQVEGVGVADLSPLFAAAGENPNFPIVVEKRSGAHTLYVDEFEARGDASATPPSSGGPSVVIDDFRRDQLNWFTLGGADLSLSSSGNPLGRRALEVRYLQAEGSYVVVMHPLAQANLATADRLEFDLASEQSAQVLLSVETKKSGGGKGSRYNTTLDVPGHRKPVHATIPFADFKLDANGPPDPAGRLDAGRIKSLALADISGASSVQEQKNTLWVSNIVSRGALSDPPVQSTTPVATAHSHDVSAPTTPMNHDAHEMPTAMSHNEDAHVTESMSSHHLHMGPHMKLTDPRTATPEERKKAEAIVATLRESIKKYTDYHVAIQDGYLPYLPNLPQPEYHFTNNGYGYLEAFRFDPAHPTSLLYKKTPSGYDLVGAMYTAPEKATEDALNARVPLGVARWHLHVNVCLPQGGMTQQVDWKKFGPGGSIVTEEECTAAGGKFLPNLFGWMVHVYPFEQNPDQIWAH